MRASQSCICAFVLLSALTSSTWGQADVEPSKASLCELYQHPEQYSGKIVRVRASVSGNDLSLEDFSERQSCSAYMRVHLELPESVKPKPGFDLVRDDTLNELFDALHKGMNVVATYDGRFDPAFVWHAHKREPIGQGQAKGYGKKQRYDGRIVLQRVTEVVARPMPRR
jgi:hypothetical protein